MTTGFEGHALGELSAEDIATLMHNKEESGKTLDLILAVLRGHRITTGCRAWGCCGSPLMAEYMARFESWELAQLLVSAMDRILDADAEPR